MQADGHPQERQHWQNPEAYLHLQAQPDQKSAYDYRCHPGLPLLRRTSDPVYPMSGNQAGGQHWMYTADRRLVGRPSTDEELHLQERCAEDADAPSERPSRTSSLQVLQQARRAYWSWIRAQRALWSGGLRRLVHGPRRHAKRPPTHRSVWQPMPTRPRNVAKEQVVQHLSHQRPRSLGMGMRVQPNQPKRQRIQRPAILHPQRRVHAQ